MPAWRFFDCNAMVGHTLAPQPELLPTVDHLLRAMDHFGIERSLFYHNAATRDEMNRRTVAAAHRSRRLVPCWVLSSAPSRIAEKIEDQVDRLLEAGVKAARFVPDPVPPFAPLTLRVWALQPMLERLNRHRIPVLIDGEHLQQPEAADTYGWDQIHAICGACPETPIVLLQVRYGAQGPLAALMRRHGNLHFTIPWFGLHRQVESMAAMFGPERLLFGTNLPHGDPGMPVGMVNYARLTSREKALIAGENLERILAAVL